MKNIGLIKVQCKKCPNDNSSDNFMFCSISYLPKGVRCKNRNTIIDWITYLRYSYDFIIISETISEKELSSFWVLEKDEEYK